VDDILIVTEDPRAIQLTHHPATFKGRAVRPGELATAVLLVILVFSDVDSAVRPGEYTFTIYLIV